MESSHQKGKKGKKLQQDQLPSKQTSRLAPEIPASIYERDGKVYLVINAKPNAKTSAIQGTLSQLSPAFNGQFIDITDEGIGVSIAAPPKEGQANDELIEFLIGVLGVHKSEIDLDKGSKSRSKIVIVESSNSAKDIYELLKSQL